MDTLFTIGFIIVGIGIFVAYCKVVSHPVNKNNFEHSYYYDKHNPVIDPWNEINYRHPRS